MKSNLLMVIRIFLLSIVSLTVTPPQTIATPLKAGAARIDLTPPMELEATLGGYGDRMSKPAVGVHDRIFAKCIVISDGTSRFALVTADVLAFPSGFKSALIESLAYAGWKSSQIMLLPSHSHTSIDMSALNPRNTLGIPQIGLFHKELYDLTIAHLAQVITEAAKDQVAISASTHTIQLHGWNRNRRKDNEAYDPDLTVTRIDKVTGQPLAVLVNWTAHPTFMGPDDMMFSGGWPGHLQRTIEALIGQGVTAMYYNGAQADQSPIRRKDSGGNWERAECYGRELGIIVCREWKKIKPIPSPAFSYHAEQITLPACTWHPDFMKTGGSEYGLSEEIMEKVLTLMTPKNTVSGSFRLGSLLIVGIPGEITVQLGKPIKSQVRQITGIQHVVVGGLANEWVSYILSAEEYNKGGYEASVSFYGETLGQVIVEGALKGVSKIPVTTENFL
ncbi:MAG: neutral/alkaline non-lysosomal ceramidase N-terminal domain-containing protein [Planctomycetota bacterium]